MKLQVRVFARDGKRYFQTVATKGKEVIPFIYRGDIIYLPLVNEDEGHDEMHDKVVSCLQKQAGINYKLGRWTTPGSKASHYLERNMFILGYEQDEVMSLEDVENSTILSYTQTEMLKMQYAEVELYNKEMEYITNGKV
jgi:hypothetical protein|tara:strand:- start:124 stop:540 length:417 start_codon:yes stop_codon:yes gene_type:complete